MFYAFGCARVVNEREREIVFGYISAGICALVMRNPGDYLLLLKIF